MPKTETPKMDPPPWADEIAAEVLREFCKTHGVQDDDFTAAVKARNKPLYKARFRKLLQAALDRDLDRQVREQIATIL